MSDRVLHISRLRSLGIEPTAATARRMLRPIRRGWYAYPDASEAELIAARACASITCVTLLSDLGVFTPPDDDRMHVAITSSSRPRSSGDTRGLVTHWGHRLGEATYTAIRTTRREALGHALRCQPPDMAVAITDSVLQTGILTRSAVAGVFRRMPRRIRYLEALVDGRSESGIESLVRFRLARVGVSCEVQRSIPEVGRVDLLIDGWLAIELDGREHHATEFGFENDRRRDRVAVRRGFVTLRFTYADIIYRWPETLAEIMALRAEYSRA